MTKACTNIGEYIRQKRIELGYSLRKFCSITDLDPGYISRVERNVLGLTNDETIKKIAKALEIEQGGDEWNSYLDLIQTSKGAIPQDLKNNKRFIKSLPLFFRTVRGKRPSEEDLKNLITILKESDGNNC